MPKLLYLIEGLLALLIFAVVVDTLRRLFYGDKRTQAREGLHEAQEDLDVRNIEKVTKQIRKKLDKEAK